MNRRPVLLAALLAGLCSTAPIFAADAPSAKSLSRAEIATAVASSMDKTADPCNDFYRYACGGWLDSTKIPADQSRWVRSFSTITERNRELVKNLLEEAGKNAGTDPERRQIGDFYAACMDEPAVERAGLAPLAGMFAEVEKVKDAGTLLTVAAELAQDGVGVLFGGGAAPDFKNPRMNLLFLTQGGLGLPDRDYYVSDDPKKKAILVQYESHVARMLTLAGESTADATADARRIVGFETELARASRPRAEMRDRDKIYNKIDRSGLVKLTPRLALAALLRPRSATPTSSRSTSRSPEFYQALERLATTTPPRNPARLPALERRRQPGQPAAEGVRGRQLRLLRQDPLRPAGDPAPLEALRHRDHRRARRGDRQDLRRAGVRRQQQGSRGRDDPRHRERFRVEPRRRWPGWTTRRAGAPWRRRRR